MSRSTLYRVYKTKAVPFAEFPNSYGSAPPVWGYLCVRYLHGEAYDWLTKGRGNYQPLWNLVKDQAVPEWLRMVHAFTFDRAIVTEKHRAELVAACRQAFRAFATWAEWGSGVNHWQAIADVIESTPINKRCLGLGIGCTSVSDPWEWYKPPEKPWDCVEYVKQKEKQL